MKKNYMKIWILLGFLCCFSNLLQAQFTLNAPADGFNYQWFINESNTATPISGATNVSFTTNTPGVYFATYDKVGCGGASDYFVLIDSCNGEEQVTLNLSNQGNYSWNNGATGNSITVEATPTPTTYMATVSKGSCNSNLPAFTVVNKQNCACSANIGILSTDMPEVCFNETNMQIVASVTTPPTVPVGHETVYILTRGNNLIIEQLQLNTPVFTITTADDYSIHTLIAETNDPSSADFFNLNQLTLGSSTLLDLNDLLALNPTKCNSFDLVGTLINVLPATDENCINTTGNTSGNPSDEIEIYNLISPNGDGVNDTFVIVDVAKYPNNSLQIYNRWGTVVYSKASYNNEFNGISNAKLILGDSNELPEGTYFYVFEKGNGADAKVGWLYINR